MLQRGIFTGDARGGHVSYAICQYRAVSAVDSDSHASAPTTGRPQLHTEFGLIADGDEAVWFNRCLTMYPK
ncbi:hypothetical protein CFB89_08940 [Burkholderia sp. AU16741]|uniref:hypothetical protein n=1 Tax=unclassified Burkholderia TaxID=2613784 RepID=UPI000B79DDE6|nr:MULTISPECIES: hypothetical protein [unclassified Burkholderia]MDN7430635.1 hypothetical protein [Burkholderia sp. AU45388]OXI34832.1 hypothetical protein CFB89_08940 [Burkholderia sp. AU16741]